MSTATAAAEPSTRAVFKAVGFMAAVVATGTLGLAWIEGWDAWRAFFFTIISVTTVGYGDEGLSEAGRRFTVLILLVGIGAASYGFAQIMQWAVASQLAWRKRMQHRVAKLFGHTIVCGFGRMGRAVCERLQEGGAPFVVIEHDDAGFEAACANGWLAVQGCVTDDEVLERAGVARAAHLVATVDSEADNIVATLSARELNPDLLIITRADRAEEVRKLRRAGATRIVAPFQSGGLEIANAILRPSVAAFLERTVHSDSGIAMGEIAVEAGSELAGVALRDCGKRENGVAFVALQRVGDDLVIRPAASEILRAGDVLIVAGDSQGIASLYEGARCPNRTGTQSGGLQP